MYDSVDFSILTKLYNYGHNQILDHFVIPKQNTLPNSYHLSIPLPEKYRTVFIYFLILGI